MQFICRFKHPVSLPEEMGKDLGVRCLDHELSFHSCIQSLTSPTHCPRNLKRFMKRSEAEMQFGSALKKEHFKNNSLFSYYLFRGWFSFDLVFDEQDQLRRLYIQHRRLEERGESRLEIPLPS